MNSDPRLLSTRTGEFELFDEGEGPAVVLLHGWPELALSWRHQIAALSAGGYQVIAPNQRGYGRSHAPQEIEAYTLPHLVGDVVAVLDALEIERAAVIGHDWGAPVAWHCALFRPERFPAVAGLSVPYAPRGEVSLTQAMRAIGAHGFYMLYFQEPGRAEAELEADLPRTLRDIYWSASGDSAGWSAFAPPGGGLLDSTSPAPGPLAWLPERELARYVEAFRHSGMRGPLNWYRNIDRNHDLLAAYHAAVIGQPSLFIAGERDGVLKMPGFKPEAAHMRRVLPGLRGLHLLPGAGHWIQQERPEEVSRLLLEFLGEVWR